MKTYRVHINDMVYHASVEVAPTRGMFPLQYRDDLIEIRNSPRYAAALSILADALDDSAAIEYYDSFADEIVVNQNNTWHTTDKDIKDWYFQKLMNKDEHKLEVIHNTAKGWQRYHSRTTHEAMVKVREEVLEYFQEVTEEGHENNLKALDEISDVLVTAFRVWNSLTEAQKEFVALNGEMKYESRCGEGKRKDKVAEWEKSTAIAAKLGIRHG